MKKIKLIICLTIAIIMSLQAFCAASYEAAAETDRFFECTSFLSSLGIGEEFDFSDSKRLVSRGEFVSLAVEVLNLSMDFESDGTFHDVKKGHIYENGIYKALSAGLLKGTGDGAFRPDDAITYEAAVKVLVAALGYESYAYASGGYPAGYIYTAKSIGLLKGAASENGSVNMGTAAALISNALRCDVLLSQSVSGDYVTYASEEGRSCLSEYFGLTKLSGIMTTAGCYSMKSGYSAYEPEAEIGGIYLKTSIKNPEKYIGLSVDGWYDAESSCLVAVYPRQVNKTVSISAENLLSYSNFRLKATNGYGFSEYKLDRGYHFLLNGRLMEAADGDFVFDSGALRLIDNDGDGDYDIVFAEKGFYMVAQRINADTKEVYDKANSGKSFFAKNTDGYSCFVTVNGKEASADDIERGVALRVNLSKDKMVSSVFASSKKVSGRVTEITDKSIFIDNKEYKTNYYFNKYSSVAPGQTVTVLLADDETATYVSKTEDDKMHYGYFLDFDNRKKLSENGKIKVLEETGEYSVFPLSNVITFDGETVNADSERLKNAFLTGAGAPKYQLIRYGLNAAGAVSVIDTAENAADTSGDTYKIIDKYSGNPISENSLTRFVNRKKALLNQKSLTFIPYCRVGNTVLFSAPEKLGEEEAASRYDDRAFSVVSPNEVRYTGYLIDAYDYNEKMEPSAVVVYNGGSTTGGAVLKTPSVNSRSYFIEDVVDFITDEKELTKKIYMYSDGKFSSAILDPELLSAAKKNMPRKGDICRFVFSGGYICGIAVDVKAAEDGKSVKKIEYAYNTDEKPDTRIYATLSYASGKVFSISENHTMALLADNYTVFNDFYSEPADGICCIAADSSTHIVIYNSTTGKTEHGNISQIKDARSVGEENASYIAVRLGGYVPELIVVYR